MNPLQLYLAGILAMLAFGSAAYAVSGGGSDRTKKRLAAIRATGADASISTEANTRREAIQASLRELEQAGSKTKKRVSLQRRIEQAGLAIPPRTYWIASGIAGGVGAVVALMVVGSFFAFVLAGFASGLGLPRWVLSFLRARREKAFTREFAPAMDAIVRSVKSGLPVIEALKLVASEIPEPVAGEFRLLTDSLKVGLTMEQGIKRMFQRMPTAEVNFFGIVMSMQTKSGGNLSEALGNLAGVLRERKRLKDKIRAMSSEAKAGAMIIGSLPPGVMMMVYVTTPDYMRPLFSTEIGKVLLMGCAVWMGIGIAAMKKMINMKY